MGRSLLAVLLGLILANVAVFVFEFVGHVAYPPPPGLDLSDPKALRAVVANMPVGAFLVLLFGWVVGTAVGAWLAARVSRRAPTTHALIVGGVIMAGAIANMILIPHPTWFWVLSLAAILPAASAGALLAKRGTGSGREHVSGDARTVDPLPTPTL